MTLSIWGSMLICISTMCLSEYEAWANFVCNQNLYIMKKIVIVFKENGTASVKIDSKEVGSIDEKGNSTAQNHYIQEAMLAAKKALEQTSTSDF